MKDEEEMVDVDIKINEEIAKKFERITKKELLNNLYVLILKGTAQGETIATLNKENTALRNAELIQTSQDDFRLRQAESRLRQAEEYGEQARTMIDALMERWYDYN